MPRGTLVIGDSLQLGTGKYLRGAKVNAVGGRSSAAGVKALAKMVRGRRGRRYQRVVFDLGTNDGSAGQLRQSIRKAKRLARGKPVYMATVNGPKAAAKNRVIKRSGVNVIDWAGRSKGLVPGDGIHASPQGYKKRARLIASNLYDGQTTPKTRAPQDSIKKPSAPAGANTGAALELMSAAPSALAQTRAAYGYQRRRYRRT